MSHAKRKIYLAGPITGTDYNDSRFGWRKTFNDLLVAIQKERTNYEPWLECFSPMREKEFLEKDQCISGAADYASLHGFGTPQGILTRDHNDVRNCDAMVACFLGAKRVSIGTCVEFGFAYSYRKPVIMVMETMVEDTWATGTDDEGGFRQLVPGVKNPHDHVFLRACAGYVVPTLGHAADIVYSLLTPGL
jgi:nucleoside 2-deoxyribosyltransferase